MKTWLWIVSGLVLLFVFAIGFVLYRVYTFKPVLPPRSPLAQAVFDGDTDRVSTLLKEGADANSTMDMTYHIEPDGHMSSFLGNIPIFGGSQPKAPPKSGMSVLAFASMGDCTDMTRLLLDKGANVNSTDEYGQTPLILAAWSGDAKTVQLLLDHHADTSVRDQSGKTALMWAQTEGHQSVVKALKTAGAKE